MARDIAAIVAICLIHADNLAGVAGHGAIWPPASVSLWDCDDNLGYAGARFCLDPWQFCLLYLRRIIGGYLPWYWPVLSLCGG